MIFKKLLFAWITTFYLCFSCIGQSSSLKTSLDNLHPVSPTAFQFQKYTDMPVSEYTGIPNISIPLYTISEDGVQVPLGLTYHSVGIRVNQEASWVGLGWDLTIGSVVQTINDKDDYGVIEPSTQPYTKILPDYNSVPIATEWPPKYNYPYTICQWGCSGQVPINSPTDQHGFKIATDFYVPINGYYDRNTNLFDDEYVDSEPDVFTASFLGHSIKFIRKISPDQLVVLNKKGYSVQRVNGNWKIVVPSGEEFYFEEKNISESYSFSDKLSGGSFGGTWEPSSITWLLTKIVTKNKSQILFTYNYTSINNLFTTYSEKYEKPTLTQTVQFQNAQYCNDPHRGEVTIAGSNSGPPVLGTLKTFTYSREKFLYLSSITFPNGQINFTCSDRIDVAGGKKLDQVVINNTQAIKTFQFNYDYFDGSTVGGNGYTAATGTISTHRLKLNSIQDNSGAIHTFFYNSTSLPKKNSYSTDYWGFYNGQVSNTTIYPNPSQFNRPDIGNNGDNHSSNLTYAKAGILEAIQYPTGGKVTFDYELNEFDNYWVPDFSSSNNTTSKGNGLRVKSITFRESENKISKKVNYTYSGGKAILPVQFIRGYTYKEVDVTSWPNGIVERLYTIDEVNANGFFSPSLCGSISGVGYSSVIKEEVDLNSQANGRTETIFYNNPDIATNSANATTRISAVLPAFKNKNVPENGSVQSVLYKDNQNNLIKKIDNTYLNIQSQIFYGARIFSYGSYVYYQCAVQPFEQIITAQHLVGYYPIFDFETLLQSSTTTDYANGSSLITTTNYTYDYLNRPASSTRVNSDGSTETEVTTFPNYGINAIQTIQMDNNRLLDMVNFSKNRNGNAVYRYTKDYNQFGDKILETKTTITEHVHPYDNKPTEIYYDLYDAGGNLLQYTKQGSTTSVLWDYNTKYVIAEVKNSVFSNTAYTSFEADGTGNWNFSGTPTTDNSSPTGKKAYALSGGPVSKSGLNSSLTYTVSYWSKNGTQNANGTTATAGRSISGWTYYEHIVPNPSGGVVTVSGSGTIDELRLYPQNALMASYTYVPLIGMTAQCDANNRITYHEYDAFNRLAIIRDQDKKILKKICYNFAGQVENCASPLTYYNAQASQSFTRNNCPAGYTGSSVTYTVPASTYNSTISQADADQQAQNDISANGQAYANANGTCTQNPPCNESNCSGVDKKCINNICETGIKIYKTSTYFRGVWTCTYVYRWSDCSESTIYTETGSSPCTIGGLCN